MIPQPTWATPARLTVTAWPDPIVDARGHRPGAPYVESVWLGTLGPSATWAWQRLARIAGARPGTTIDSADLAATLGLGDGLARNAVISRTLTRLVNFGVATRHDDTLAVRTALPDLPLRHLARASTSARAAHHAITGRPLPAPTRSPQAAPVAETQSVTAGTVTL
jgi:hypothetical protein